LDINLRRYWRIGYTSQGRTGHIVKKRNPTSGLPLGRRKKEDEKKVAAADV
jgi:hypothetical protein